MSLQQDLCLAKKGDLDGLRNCRSMEVQRPMEQRNMNPWKVSAQFAAYMWFTKKEGDAPGSPVEARRFAKQNWVAFLPYADEGVGRLLIAIAKPTRPLGGKRMPVKAACCT